MTKHQRKENKTWSNVTLALSMNIWTNDKYRAWRGGNLGWRSLGWVEILRKMWLWFVKRTYRRVLEIEQQTRHDELPSRAVSETLGEKRKWVHYGLTSTDVLNYGPMVTLQTNNDISARILNPQHHRWQAKEHKFTIMMGRTHGVHAEPTTFVWKLATWYSEMKRNIERFEACSCWRGSW